MAELTTREAIANRISGGAIVQLAETNQQLAEVNQNTNIQVQALQENMARLEAALYSADWQRLTATGRDEFTRNGLQTIVELARLMRLKNPIIKRGVEVQRLYTWAQGVTIRAVDPDINDVIQAFMNDERNKAEFTTHQARGEKEDDLQTEANIFFRFFVDTAVSGRVRVRAVPFDEITDIFCNPEDAKEPWFYIRSLNGKTIYYPDFRFNPEDKKAAATQLPSGSEINWETAVYHVATNKFGKFGVCEFYAALDWALAYKTFLEQLASVWRALARWAVKVTTDKGKAGVSAAKSELATTEQRQATGTIPTAQTFIGADGTSIQPFRTSGATMSAEDGRRLLLMAAAVFGFPETFFGDVSVGTLATARSLDRPTELKIKDRQSLWADVHREIFSMVLKWAVKAPQGPLKGKAGVVTTKDGDEIVEAVEWNEDVDPTIIIEFPEIISGDTAATISSIVDAATMKGDGGGIPKETAVSQLLTQLGIKDIDAVMEIWREEQASNQAENAANDATG